MNINELHAKLILAARSWTPSEDVPVAFEKRIMAQLRRGWEADLWTLWGRLLWKAAAPCVACSLFLGIWILVATPSSSADSASVDLEAAVMAPLNSPSESW